MRLLYFLVGISYGAEIFHTVRSRLFLYKIVINIIIINLIISFSRFLFRRFVYELFGSGRNY